MERRKHFRSPRERRLQQLDERRRRQKIFSAAAIACAVAAILCLAHLALPQRRTTILVATRNVPAGNRIAHSAVAPRTIATSDSDRAVLTHLARRPRQVIGKVALAPLRKGSPIPLSSCASHSAVPAGYATLNLPISGDAPDILVGQKVDLAAVGGQNATEPNGGNSSEAPTTFTAIVRAPPHQSVHEERQNSAAMITVAVEASVAVRLAQNEAQTYLIVGS